MKKLTIPNGGMPFEGDDLTFMQQGLTNGIGDVLRAMSPDKGDFILRGVDLIYDSTNSTVTWSDGIISIDYEPCFVSAGTLAAVSDFALVDLELSVSNDPAGLDVFADSVSKNTYEVRSGAFVLRASVGAVLKPASALRRMRSLVNHEVDIPIIGGSGANGFLKLRCSNGIVRLEGAIGKDLPVNSFPGLKIADIPAQYIPINNVGIYQGNPFKRQWILSIMQQGYADVRLVLQGSELYLYISDAYEPYDVPSPSGRLIEVHDVSWWI